MNKMLYILGLVLLPVLAMSQLKADSSTFINTKSSASPVKFMYHADTAFTVMFNAGTGIYYAADPNIEKFLIKYGYVSPRDEPVALKLEFALMPFKSKMILFINGSTIISRQDVITADFELGAYRRLLETKKLWVIAGISSGGQFDRVVLNGRLPPAFDSLATQYGRTLSLHRTGFIAEPGVKVFWYPIQNRRSQFGIFASAVYDVNFNGRWRLGYYSPNSNTFKNLKTKTDIGSLHEFGFGLSAGISICF